MTGVQTCALPISLLRLYSQETLDDGDVGRVVEILDRLGAREYCQGMVREQIDEALAELDATGISPSARRQFTELAEFLLAREF